MSQVRADRRRNSRDGGVRAGIAPAAVELGKEALPRVRLTVASTAIRIRRPTRDTGPNAARLDTLFLTMPISWRGTLAQYAGRLHRLHAAKREVIIFDYVDGHEPMFAKMATRREAGYRALGYEVVDAADLFSQRTL